MSATLRPLESFASKGEIPSQTTAGIVYHPQVCPDGTFDCDCEAGKNKKRCWHIGFFLYEREKVAVGFLQKEHGWKHAAEQTLEEIIAAAECEEINETGPGFEFRFLRRLVLRVAIEDPSGKVWADPVYEAPGGKFIESPTVLGSALASLIDDEYLGQITMEHDGEILYAYRKSSRNGARPCQVFKVTAEGREHFREGGD